MNKQIQLLGLLIALSLVSAFIFVYKYKHPKLTPIEDNTQPINEDNNLDIPKLWSSYQKEYKIHFDDSKEEEEHRYKVFQQNILYIQGKPGLSVTEFMHLDQVEFAEQSFGLEENESGQSLQFQTISLSTQSIDWQSKGVVSPVKNQGLCESSWAFSVVAGVESALLLKNGSMISLSEQYFIDCNSSNASCNGGDRKKAFDFVIEQGLNTSLENPYKAFQSKCKYTEKQQYTIQSYKNFNSCNDVLSALQQGPLIVGIDGTNLQFYKQGILQTTFTHRNLGALLVGYNQEQGYWKLKTSLSSKFGEQGYIRLSASIKNGQIENTAGICDSVYQVII